MPEAEKAFKAALELSPSNAVAGNELGITERKLGKFADAEAAYQRAIAAEPNYAPAHLNLGVLYDLYLGEPQKALEQFERYIEIAGENKQVAGWVVELRKRVGAPAPPAKRSPHEHRNDRLSSTALGFAMSAANAQQPPASAPAATRGAAPPRPRLPRLRAKPAKATAQSEAGEPRADTSRPPPGRASSPTGPGNGGRAGWPEGPASVDRLELGTATVTGDREQPKVMYIVPWKKSDIGDLAGKPMNSLVDEILAPVDRDVFKREVVYYKAVQADASQNGAPRPPVAAG